MLRLIGLALAGLLALAQPLNAAGTVPGFSLTPQFDELGKVMPGCRLYVIQAGTTQTPQNSYQDAALTILQPNPLVCDASGRIPQFFVSDGTIKLRLTNQAGSQKFVGDNLLVVGASSGGGGGGTVDPTTILQTGDWKIRHGTGVVTGFVRLNGRTVGSATSGATERANADCQALFEYLWNSDSNLVVSTGRGASANADWVANKTIALPDWRGYALGGLADMGNSATSVLTSTYFGSVPTVLGIAGGVQASSILQANLPGVGIPVTVSGSVSGTLTSGATSVLVSPTVIGFQGGGGSATVAGATGPIAVSGTLSGGMTGSTVALGSGQLYSQMQPTRLTTFYIKL